MYTYSSHQSNMLQFTLIPSPNMSIAAQASMAINAGCSWIEIDPTGIGDNDLQSIIDTCRDHEIILVFKHNDLLLEKTRVHGIHLGQADIDPLQLRERLGGHPIIGVDVTSETPMQPLKRADIDYVVLTGYPDNISTSDIQSLHNNQQSQGITFPIVVSGQIKSSELQSLINAGASGFNIDINSLQAPEYEVSLAAFKNAADSISRH